MSVLAWVILVSLLSLDTLTITVRAYKLPQWLDAVLLVASIPVLLILCTFLGLFFNKKASSILDIMIGRQ